MRSLNLCRAKNIQSREWVVGYYVLCDNKHYIKNGDNLNKGWNLIDENTLCKYCGIDDVCNQMAFEGDILEEKTYDYFQNLTFVDYYVLQYPANHYGFVLQTVQHYVQTNPKNQGYCIPRKVSKMKIIGNIIDNSSLLNCLAEQPRVFNEKAE